MDGVPESHCSACRKALIALDHPDLHEYANILARRSLEAILRTEYNGNTLAALIDTMLQDKESGLSRGLLKNIDAIRNLGNIGAHDIPGNAPEPLRADKEQTSWNINPGNPGYIFAEPTVGYRMEQGDGPEPEAESSG